MSSSIDKINKISDFKRFLNLSNTKGTIRLIETY